MLAQYLTRSAGGIYSSVLELSTRLNKHCDVEVAASGLKDLDYPEDESQWAHVEADVHEQLGPAAFGFSPGMWHHVLHDSMELVHLHGLWQFTSLISLWCTKITGTPHVVSPHGMLDEWALNNSRVRKNLALMFYEQKNLQSAFCIHALCESEYKSLRDIGLTVPICVIPNGVSIPDQSSAELPRSRQILYLGRIHSKKGIFELLDAWKLVKENSSLAKGWTLKIAGWGDGKDISQLEKRISEMEATGGLSFVGPVFDEQKARLFFESSVFILPSKSEGLPMTVLEAWSHSTPVIMTKECNLSVGFEERAALPVTCTVDSIAAGISSLIAMNDEQREEMGENGKNLVVKSFSWEAVVREWVQVYRWILKGGETPRCVKF
jgi:glycosyltransferase involved in cell wall biosynthesis